ncbi:hypothetical protein D9M69_695790 [compost metagenome]
MLRQAVHQGFVEACCQSTGAEIATGRFRCQATHHGMQADLAQAAIRPVQLIGSGDISNEVEPSRRKGVCQAALQGITEFGVSA